MKLSIILLTILIATNCTNTDNTINNAQKADTSKPVTINPPASITVTDTAFKLDFFTAVPDTIDGCGEYITYYTSKITNDKFIFLSNLSEFAIIRIKGKDIYLNRDMIESQEINDKNYIAVYEGQGYKAILSLKQKKANDEGGFYTGTLQITGNKVNVTFKVHGQVGC